MRQLTRCATIAVTLLANTSCGRNPPAAVDREEAYRAINLGVALLEQYDYDAAASAFQRAIDLDNSLAPAHLNLSLALLYDGRDLKRAQHEAGLAARLAPTAPQSSYVLALIAVAENQTDEAVRLFRRVQEFDQRDVGTLIGLGQIYLKNRDYPAAISTLRTAVSEEPHNVTASYALGQALIRSGQRLEGDRALQRSQTLRDAPYAVTFGSGYLEQGKYAEAIASTGAEPELIDAETPKARYTAASIDPRMDGHRQLQSPMGRRYRANQLTSEGSRAIASSLGGGLTLVDFDGDTDFDVFVAAADAQRLFRNDGRDSWTEVSAASGVSVIPAGTVPIGAVAGDYDNDGAVDLFVLRYGGNTLYRNDGTGVFRDVTTAARLPPYRFLPAAAAFVDSDHDGDLDLVVAGLADFDATRRKQADRLLLFPAEFAPAPLQLLRNNGNATFTDIARESGLDVSAHVIAVAPTDFDNRRDVDLLVVSYDRPPMLFKNMRGGAFRDVAHEVGLTASAGPNDEVLAVTVADVNKDDFPDILFARASGGVLALSDARGRFTQRILPVPRAHASQFLDYDNDGLLDLFVWSVDRPHVFRNLVTRWMDVSDTAIARADGGTSWPLWSPRGMAVADLDRDGHTDVVVGGDRPTVVWRNSGDGSRRGMSVRLKGRASNTVGIGSKIQVRAGSLSARYETSATTPAVAAADVLIGIGSRSAADVVRVLWPSGTLQAETVEASKRSLVLEELDRKPSSCPLLFAWNGNGFEFVTDFMGAGELGYWVGPAARNRPDPLEYVRIRGDQLQPRDGRFELRVTNELEETIFIDRLQLIGIDHPSEIEVYPNEGMTDPPKPHRLHAIRAAGVPKQVVDDNGRDVTNRIARLDRRYVDDFAVGPLRGFAAPHKLTIDLGDVAGPSLLLLTGWTDYAFSSDNVAAHQSGLSLDPPTLQAKDASGAWRTLVADIGIPVGRPQTIPVDLAGLRPGEREVRIVTNMRVYWDQILVAARADGATTKTTSLDAAAALLRVRGFSAAIQPDGTQPDSYDYQRVDVESPWKVMTGRYTRLGDVRTLLTNADDMFAILKPGDEIALSFDAASMSAVAKGQTRTFLLLADGFSKEMDINSASPDAVEPLPFHGMSRYPYSAPERYPDSAAYRAYRETYNTRVVVRPVPVLASPLAAPRGRQGASVAPAARR